MNKNKNILKLLKILITALLMFIPLMTACAGLQTTSPPTPPVKFPFDVSKKGNTINQEFMIGDKPGYGFELRFEYFGSADEHRVFKLVGHGSDEPGIAIPIHIKIYKLNNENVQPKLIYEDTILTEECYAHGFERNQANGHYLRTIVNIRLTTPGIYRVEASTIDDKPEFTGTPTYLYIEHPGHR